MTQFQPMLDDREWTLILQLLEQEQNELPSERHHSDRREYAHALDERKMAVDNLIQRLRAQGVKPQ